LESSRKNSQYISCAVRAALAEGKLSQTRYDSYCAMYDEVKDVKEWQRRGL